MGIPQEDKNQVYTYADYASWDLAEGERYELIDGKPYAMSAPSVKHQQISGELVRQLGNFLKDSKNKSCQVFHAPFDVCLFGLGEQERTVVQPDISIVCDNSKNKLENGKRCNGAPEFIVEILSPSTSTHDWFYKLNKYLQAGVREYWIVDTQLKKIFVHLLKVNKYDVIEYKETDTIPVTVLDSCEINLSEMFS
jgi:Uma2 family endonuclease